MAPLCKLVKRGAVQANDLPLRNDLEAWPDSSAGRALDVQCQGSRVRIPLGSVIFSHFHFSLLCNSQTPNIDCFKAVIHRPQIFFCEIPDPKYRRGLSV